MRIWSCHEGRWSEGDRGAGVRWYDLCQADAPALRDLAGRFGLHPLAIEDCLSPYLHTPKADDFQDHLFVVLAAMAPGVDAPQLEELDLFLGTDFLITYHDRKEPPPAIDATIAALEQGIAIRPGTDGLFYEIADRSVDAIFPRVSGLSDRLDAVEDEIVSQGKLVDQHRRILALRADAGKARRLLAPELVLMLRFARGEVDLITEQNRPYFRDVYDHLVRVDLSLEGLREDAEVALSTYLSAMNNKMNEVMKVLAVVGALALPATVITGVFGTNFDDIPGLHSNWGFAAMMLGMGSLAGGMALYFYRRGWF